LKRGKKEKNANLTGYHEKKKFYDSIIFRAALFFGKKINKINKKAVVTKLFFL